jgi:hypothetical protein
MKRKRKQPDDINQFLPDPVDEAARIGSLEFDEVLDEEVSKWIPRSTPPKSNIIQSNQRF